MKLELQILCQLTPKTTILWITNVLYVLGHYCLSRIHYGTYQSSYHLMALSTVMKRGQEAQLQH